MQMGGTAESRWLGRMRGGTWRWLEMQVGRGREQGLGHGEGNVLRSTPASRYVGASQMEVGALLTILVLRAVAQWQWSEGGVCLLGMWAGATVQHSRGGSPWAPHPQGWLLPAGCGMSNWAPLVPHCLLCKLSLGVHCTPALMLTTGHTCLPSG